jgi:hypothetical protein
LRVAIAGTPSRIVRTVCAWCPRIAPGGRAWKPAPYKDHATPPTGSVWELPPAARDVGWRVVLERPLRETGHRARRSFSTWLLIPSTELRVTSGEQQLRGHHTQIVSTETVNDVPELRQADSEVSPCARMEAPPSLTRQIAE